MKILSTLNEYSNQGKTFYSFEFFPPKTDFGLDNLYSRIDRMAALRPAYIDVTWGAGGSTAEKTFDMSKTIQKYFGLDVMMHLTCTNMPKDSIKQVLLDSKENNISNILALRGDPPEGTSRWENNDSEFNNGIDLVKYIRNEFGDSFFIGVGGYPETHQEQKDSDLDISFLKQKVDAGADIIITQLFYDVEKFLLFRDKCFRSGINVPIIPDSLKISANKPSIGRNIIAKSVVFGTEIYFVDISLAKPSIALVSSFLAFSTVSLSANSYASKSVS